MTGYPPLPRDRRPDPRPRDAAAGPGAHRLPLSAARTVLGAAGVALIGWGLYGLLHDAYIRDPGDVLVWGVAGLVLHDAVWMPLLLAVGTPLARCALLRGGLTVAAALAAVGLPAVLRTGRDHGNPTLLPLPYQRNLLLLLGLVAALTALAALAGAAVRRTRTGPGRRGAGGGPRRGARRSAAPAPPGGGG